MEKEVVTLRRKILLALVFVFALVLLFSAWQLMLLRGEYRAGQDSYDALAAAVREPEPPYGEAAPKEPPAPPSETAASSAAPVYADDTRWPEVDFDALAAINEDVIGWIYIEGTRISYPVVKSDDNEYYLDHLFDGTRNKAGCIFLDMASSPDFSDANSTLHGHHMKDRSMFANLVRYKDQEFYDAHPTALLLTPDARYKVHLFSGYVAEAASISGYEGLLEESREEWLLQAVSRSCFRAPCMPSAADRILTLSTCTYEYDDARFLVHGYMESIPY